MTGTHLVFGCPAGVHVRAPSASITAGVCPDLTDDEINALLWDTATGTGTDVSWGGSGNVNDSLVDKGYYMLDSDGWSTATDKGVHASEALFAARRRALNHLACASLASCASNDQVGQAVMSDRLNGASWEELAETLGIAVGEVMDVFIKYC